MMTKSTNHAASRLNEHGNAGETSDTDPGEITALLNRAGNGDEASLNRVFELLYVRLKQLAAARLHQHAHTLSPTALVNETYEKLVKSRPLALGSRAHFFACASKAMRQIIVDHARRAQAGKRGGDWLRVTFSENLESTATELLELDQALGDLASVDKRLISLVEMKFFGGLTLPEIAHQLDVSVKTVSRDWNRARAFLYARMAEPAAVGLAQ